MAGKKRLGGVTEEAVCDFGLDVFSISTVVTDTETEIITIPDRRSIAVDTAILTTFAALDTTVEFIVKDKTDTETFHFKGIISVTNTDYPSAVSIGGFVLSDGDTAYLKSDQTDVSCRISTSGILQTTGFRD